VKVMVLSADRARRRISLSLRQLHGGGPEGPGEYVPPVYDLGDDTDATDAPAEVPASSGAAADGQPAVSAVTGAAAEAADEAPEGVAEAATEVVEPEPEAVAVVAGGSEPAHGKAPGAAEAEDAGEAAPTAEDSTEP